MGASTAAGTSIVKVSDIIVVYKNHIACIVGDAIVWVHGNVIEKLFDGFIWVFRGRCLLGSNIAEADKEFGVDRSGIVQQGDYDALDTIDAFVVKFDTVISVGHVLDLGAIVDFTMFVR